jgi:hypothetical protein
LRERAISLALPLAGSRTRCTRRGRDAERRTTSLAEALDGMKTAILEKARETKQEATEIMSTYLGGDPDLSRPSYGRRQSWALR